MSPMIAVAYCLERASRLWCREEKPKQSPIVCLNCGCGTERPGDQGSQSLQVSAPERREVHRDRTLEINRGPLQYYAESYLYILVKKLSKDVERDTQKNTRKMYPALTLDQEQCLFHKPEEEDGLRFMGHWVEYTKGSFFVYCVYSGE